MEPWPEIREGSMERKNWSIVRIQQVMIAPYFSLLNIPCGYDDCIFILSSVIKIDINGMTKWKNDII